MYEWLQKDSVKAYLRLFRRLFLTALVIFLLFYVAPMLISQVRPFLFAFLMAFLLNPLIGWIQRKTKISRGILSVVVVLIVVILLAGIVGILLYAIITELTSLVINMDNIVAHVNRITGNIDNSIRAISDHIPFINAYEVERAIDDTVGNVLIWIYSRSASIAEAAINYSIYGFAGIGNFFVSFIFFLMASYFAMARFPQIKDGLRDAIGLRLYGGLRTFKNTVATAVGGYLRVQLIMASIITAFSLISFLIVGQSYAVLLSLLFFVLDFMPLIGVGGLLVPWGLITLITGDIWYGVFLLGMYVVIFMMHRLIEPKLMGREMGLSPLIALFSLYLGMRFGGVLGLILAPMIATVVVSFYKAGLFDGLKRDFKAVLNLYEKKDKDGEKI